MENKAAEQIAHHNFDGIVKGDEAQVRTYVDACLAVKLKWPKPE